MAKQWLQEGIEQGIEQGVKQGIEQGLTHERALLGRQAALRFGERAAPALARIADPEGLATAGDWIVRAGDGDELVARLMQLAEGRDTA